MEKLDLSENIYGQIAESPRSAVAFVSGMIQEN